MKTQLILAAAAVLGLAAAPALADPPSWAGKGHGKGQAMGVRGQPVPGRGNPHGTPPGLAKKPYGMPPGQAKKLWSQGERLPMGYVTQDRYVVYDPYRYDLPPAPYGSRWVRVGDRFYLAQTQTGLISQVIEGLLR